MSLALALVCSFGCEQRQSYAQGSSCAGTRADRLDRTLVHLNNVPADCQTQTQSSISSRFAGRATFKRFKNPFEKLPLNSDAVVLYFKLQAVAGQGAGAHPDPASRRRKLVSICKQIPDDLLQPSGIAVDGRMIS